MVKEVHWAQPIVTGMKIKQRVTRSGPVVISNNESEEDEDGKTTESQEANSPVMEAREGKENDESKSIASTTGWT